MAAVGSEGDFRWSLMVSGTTRNIGMVPTHPWSSLPSCYFGGLWVSPLGSELHSPCFKILIQLALHTPHLTGNSDPWFSPQIPHCGMVGGLAILGNPSLHFHLESCWWCTRVSSSQAALTSLPLLPTCYGAWEVNVIVDGKCEGQKP